RGTLRAPRRRRGRRVLPPPASAPIPAHPPQHARDLLSTASRLSLKVGPSTPLRSSADLIRASRDDGFTIRRARRRLRTPTADQHFDAHAQPAVPLEPCETRAHFLAYGASVIGGKPQIGLR